MGASGSGKSTLLHILGGMDKLTSGEYYYNDEAVHDMSMGRLNIFRRDHVSFVFQNAALMKYYTVAENIEMPLLSMNVGKKERKKIIEEKMEAVGIAHLAKSFLYTYPAENRQERQLQEHLREIMNSFLRMNLREHLTRQREKR